MKFKKASINIFEDLGLNKAEATNLAVRSKLMIAVRRYIEREAITQAEAAKRFGVKQPRISDLIRGKIDLFTADGLIVMLSRVGIRVDVRIKKPSAA